MKSNPNAPDNCCKEILGSLGQKFTLLITCHNEKYWYVGLGRAVVEVNASYGDQAEGEAKDDTDDEHDKHEDEEAHQDKDQFAKV